MSIGVSSNVVEEAQQIHPYFNQPSGGKSIPSNFVSFSEYHVTQQILKQPWNHQLEVVVFMQTPHTCVMHKEHGWGLTSHCIVVRGGLMEIQDIANDSYGLCEHTATFKNQIQPLQPILRRCQISPQRYPNPNSTHIITLIISTLHT